MSRLAELSANLDTHTVWLATNFLGINMIPVMLNEAEYAQMWIHRMPPK